MIKIRQLLPATVAIAVMIAAAPVAADHHDDPVNKTVLGPRNPALADGAQALLAGNIEQGIRLTKQGLEVAQGKRELQAGLSNMCAGYVLLGEYETALDFCNQALDVNELNWRALCNRALIYVNLERYAEAEVDLVRAEEIAPSARSLKEVRGIYLDATAPVTPSIVIDDRRAAGNNDEG